ncbi:MAG TPA: HAMP domain-containing sensor histidine kinase [Candidatus Binatia bacterium]|jgi:signal transduction histidine kinase
MRLKIIDSARQSLAWRLVVWYSVVFILSSLAVAIVSYVFVSSSLRDNRRAIEVKIGHLAELADQGGIVAVEHAATLRSNAKRRKSFFVRILDREGRVVFINSPYLWNKFAPTVDVTDIVEGAWQYLPSDGDVLEISSTRLTNGYLLQVGRTLEDREEILENYRSTIAAVTIPIVLIAFGGGIFFAFRAVRPIRDLIGTTHAIVETGRVDVRVSEESATGELAELVRLFNKMLSRIEALIAGMKQSLDNVAHDLRTPMTRFRGVAEMALRSEASAHQYRESLATCVEESDRILALLNALMDISEAETGTMRLHLETFTVREVIQQAVELYEYVAEEKGISLSFDCLPDIGIYADRSRVRQVLANLLDNAIKYTNPSGRVQVYARNGKGEVSITVTDTGTGIPAGEIPKIWDRLYRGDESRSQPGLGLGLSLVKAVVEAHHGSVEVRSNPGAGSAFTVRFSASPQIS